MPDLQRDVDFRQLVSKIDSVVNQGMATVIDEEQGLRDVVVKVVDDFRHELGFSGARIYRKNGRNYRLVAAYPDDAGVNRGLEIADDYPPIKLALVNRVVSMNADDPRTDHDLEDRLGASDFAAIEIGSGGYVVAFDTTDSLNSDDIVYALGILRHAINDKLRGDRLADVLEEARRIQLSIQPRTVPDFGSFEFAARSEPVDVVGGDFYDFIPISQETLGVAIADSSGHGLAAALQVRDVHMGLRMGLSRDFKIVRTVERMNRIIHHSTLTRRFVSMFYGELERSGLFIFVNAGHPPPLFIDANGRVRELRAGGPVLGPLPESTYGRAFVNLKPGSMVVMVTDGLLEATGGEDGSEFSRRRLLQVVERTREQSTQKIVDAIFKAVEDFVGGQPPSDDRTALVIRHPGKPEQNSD